MSYAMKDHLATELQKITEAGLLKRERVITTPQQARIAVAGGKQVLNLCANNYLGLAADPRILAAAKKAIDQWGYGLASVRFICGTQPVHQQLESSLRRIPGTDVTI